MRTLPLYLGLEKKTLTPWCVAVMIVSACLFIFGYAMTWAPYVSFIIIYLSTLADIGIAACGS